MCFYILFIIERCIHLIQFLFSVRFALYLINYFCVFLKLWMAVESVYVPDQYMGLHTVHECAVEMLMCYSGLKGIVIEHESLGGERQLSGISTSLCSSQY